jgi:hypothetical protein
LPAYSHLAESGQVILLPPLATVMQGRAQEATMFQRAYFLHYRMVNDVITTLVSIGTALLFSYLILWARL